jgi:hypothetical protein
MATDLRRIFVLVCAIESGGSLRCPYSVVSRSVYSGDMGRVITTLRMDEKLRERVTILAASEGRSVSNMVETLCRRALEEGSRPHSSVCVSASFHRPGATCSSCGGTS